MLDFFFILIPVGIILITWGALCTIKFIIRFGVVNDAVTEDMDKEQRRGILFWVIGLVLLSYFVFFGGLFR